MSPEEIFQETQKQIADLKDIVFKTPYSHKYYNYLENIEQALTQPCRLAITGRVKAGKSTLINVLLGFDYAVVGTSETTATINIFKYGKPKYEDKPILCEYIDGKTKWVSKEYLNQIQGYSDEVIEEIASIKHLTYFLEDSRLKDTVLIDTPGIDAVVGDDGDAHQVQTEAFLGLRKRHKDETISISNNADAVLLLLGDVAHESDVDFIGGFLSNRGNLSSLNTIAVMAQIDLTDERIENRFSIAKDRYNRLSAYVNCVLPISAGLKRYIPTPQVAQRIKSTLSKIPTKDILDKLLLRSAKMYFLPKIPGVELSLEERETIYPKGIPFRCFAVIAKILYENNVDEAIRIIDDISGIRLLQETLDAQFFGRSKHIKSEIAIKQVLSLIWEMVNCDIQSHTSVLTESDVEELSKCFYDIQIALEKLSQVTEDINRYFQGLVMTIENRQLFSDEEYLELSNLLSGKVTTFNDSRLNYWFGEKFNSMNMIRRKIANLAYSKYTDIAFN